MHEIGQGGFIEFKPIDRPKTFRYFCVDFRKDIEERKPEVSQANADFVVHRRLRETYFVRLPKRCDLGADVAFAIFRFLCG